MIWLPGSLAGDCFKLTMSLRPDNSRCEILHHQTYGWSPINNGIKHLSTGAGFRNHPPYQPTAESEWLRRRRWHSARLRSLETSTWNPHQIALILLYCFHIPYTNTIILHTNIIIYIYILYFSIVQKTCTSGIWQITAGPHDDGDDGTTTMCRRPDGDSSAARRRYADGTTTIDWRHDDDMTTAWRRGHDGLMTVVAPSSHRRVLVVMSSSCRRHAVGLSSSCCRHIVVRSSSCCRRAVVVT